MPNSSCQCKNPVVFQYKFLVLQELTCESCEYFARIPKNIHHFIQNSSFVFRNPSFLITYSSCFTQNSSVSTKSEYLNRIQTDFIQISCRFHAEFMQNSCISNAEFIINPRTRSGRAATAVDATSNCNNIRPFFNSKSSFFSDNSPLSLQSQ